MSPSKAALKYHSQSMNGQNQSEYTRDEVFEASCIYAKQLLEKESKKSVARYEESALDLLPKLNREDFELGKVLGRGTFGVVQEVTGFAGKNEPTRKTRYGKIIGQKIKKNETAAVEKNVLSELCFREKGNSRYAIKFLSNEVMEDHKICYRAVLDMIHDCKFLSAIDHPCILKIRAQSHCGPFHQNNFILVDKLEETLDKRIASWKRKTIRIGFGSKKKAGKAFQDRLVVAYDLISAVSHLHSKK